MSALKTAGTRLFTFAWMLLPILLLLPNFSSLSIRLFKLREPTFAVPLKLDSAIQIREDPYGSGFFGAPRNGGRRHRGVDLVAPVGTPVVAAKSGIAMIGRVHNGMGRYVEIHHPDGSMTRYAHLKQLFIHDRQRVRRDKPIGTVGKSGNARRRSIQPHLHFEVWNEHGVPVDPLTVMEKKK